jgi:uncharacterized protein involved in response to NO
VPAVSRWFIRSALVALVLGLGLAAAVAARGPLGLGAEARLLEPAALHLLTVGWLTQMVFGVAHWMFPRHSPDAPRGSDGLAWTAWATLNLGLALRVAGEPLAGLHGPRPGVLVASALLQLAAAAAFVVNTWPRIRARP